MGKSEPKIENFLKRVRKKFKIQKAIFFGSKARGNIFLDGDCDVILVSQDFCGIFFTKRIAMMYDFWKHYPLEIEPICYTPEEFKLKLKEHGIVRRAAQEGIEL